MNLKQFLFEPHISLLDKLQLTKHLSILIKSGFSLSDAFDIIKKQNKKPALKKIIYSLNNQIANGVSLYEALNKYPSVFDQLYVSLVRIGEESGNLEENLDYLVVHLKKTYDFNKKIRTALFYPKIVLGLAFVVLMGLSLFILPQLSNLFDSLSVELPQSTKILLSISQIMQNYGFHIFLGIVLAIIIFPRLVKLPFIKPLWDRFVLALPYLGSFAQSMQVASLSRNIGVMLQSGLPLSVALNTQNEACSNTVFKKYLKKIQSGVEKGDSIESLLDKFSFKHFPFLAIKMIGIGEKSGRLEDVFLYLGEYYDDEVDNTAKNFSTFIEPLILILVGIIVAFIAFSIITPIYEFTASIKR